MTELSFLLDLLLNHKLSKPTRDAIVMRLKDVELAIYSRPSVPYSGQAITASSVIGPPQAASTLAAMARHAQVSVVTPDGSVTSANPALITPGPISAPVAIVAQTPAAVAAINARQESINLALSGKPAKGETRPRKF